MIPWHSISGRYEKELLESVVPFWLKHSQDREFGGYFTCLDRDGSVYDTEKYMWMQWRIVYMFAELHQSEYSRPEYLTIAQNGFDFLYQHGRDQDGLYYFALNRAGVPSMAPYSLFSDCFAAMGSAGLFRATGQSRYREEAQKAMDHYLSRAKSSNSSLRWNKSLPGKQAYQSLGNYMMAANLALLMGECGVGNAGNGYSGELDSALDAVLNRFYHPDFGLVFENVLPDGSFDLERAAGRHLNPGHVLEAMWFLLNALQQTPERREEVGKIARIILNTLEFAWDKQYGGLYYFMDALGKPHMELQSDMKLWWVHCEAILACLYAYAATGDEAFAEWFRRIDEWTWAHFPDPEYGEWFAYLNRRGEPTHLLKGGKWKTFFHLPRMLLFSIRLMNHFPTAGK